MQKENKETNQQQDPSQQRSELKKEEEKASQQSSADGQSRLKAINPKLLFLSLLESSMRYREAYFREEIELYEQQLEAAREQTFSNPKNNIKNRFSFDRKFDDRKKALVLDAKVKMEKFNKDAYHEIESVTKQLSESAQRAFDEFSTGFALLSEEFMIANSKKDLLIVAQAYNSGKFDAALIHLKNKENEKDAIIHTNPVHHNDGELQKEQPAAGTGATAYAFSESAIAELGHQQERDLQANHHIEPSGDDNGTTDHH